VRGERGAESSKRPKNFGRIFLIGSHENVEVARRPWETMRGKRMSPNDHKVTFLGAKRGDHVFEIFVLFRDHERVRMIRPGISQRGYCGTSSPAKAHNSRVKTATQAMRWSIVLPGPIGSVDSACNERVRTGQFARARALSSNDDMIEF
jgi:hypothetical protein